MPALGFCSEYYALLYWIKSHAVVEKEGTLHNPAYYAGKSHSVSKKHLFGLLHKDTALFDLQSPSGPL
jgi:hypothetical protein